MKSHSVHCPNCDSRISIRKSGLISKRAPCPRCKEPFVIPGPDESPEKPENVETSGGEQAGSSDSHVLSSDDAGMADAISAIAASESNSAKSSIESGKKSKKPTTAKTGVAGKYARRKKSARIGAPFLISAVGLIVVTLGLMVTIVILLGKREEAPSVADNRRPARNEPAPLPFKTARPPSGPPPALRREQVEPSAQPLVVDVI